MAKAKTGSLDVPCTFQSFGYGGKGTARMGIKLAKKDITPTKCENFFCNSRMAVTLVCDPADADDAEGQGKIDDIGEIHIRSTVDIKGYRSAEDITCSLTFNHSALSDKDVLALNHIAGKTGTFVAEYIGEIPDKVVVEGSASGDEDGDGEDDAGDDDDDGDEDQQRLPTASPQAGRRPLAIAGGAR